MVSVETLEKRRFVLMRFKESREHERVEAFFNTRSILVLQDATFELVWVLIIGYCSNLKV